MKLYNSITKAIEDIRPLNNGIIRMYSCGPTVYNNLHIGNLATFIRDDLLKRTLRAQGYTVHHAMNMTDIDDKTIRDSRLPEFAHDDPMQALQNLTTKYADVFLEDIHKVGNDVDTIDFIKATETIDEMISTIQKIIDAGIGYIAEDGVYLSIEKYIAAGYTYGVLQHVDVTAARSRINNDEYEKDVASDFALWKRQMTGEPAWDATFTTAGEQIDMPGRPGWHIECSAMSEKKLGVPFDIHTGGIDLKFPHHENEIAQSFASGYASFATTFVHMSHILVDGRKMSKSLGNFYTLRDIEEKGLLPLAFRLLVLSGHYQNETHFTWDALVSAENRLRHWHNVAALQWQTIKTTDRERVVYNDSITEDLLAPLANNLNSPQLLANVDARFAQIESALVTDEERADFRAYLKAIDELTGLVLHDTHDIGDELKDLINQREQARNDKDWALSDILRDDLAQKGIGLNDTQHGAIWYYL
jgi:cysteinyl-tRNA synthetase